VNTAHQFLTQGMEKGIEIAKDDKVYLGAKSGAGSFLRVMLEDGSIAENVFGLKGAGGGGGAAAGPVNNAAAPLQVQNGVMSLLHSLPLATSKLGSLGINMVAPLIVDKLGNLALGVLDGGNF
jgi:hypothetical protein